MIQNRLLTACALFALLGIPRPLAAELRTLEVVGVAPGAESQPVHSEAPRDAALKAALREAVFRVAAELAPLWGLHPEGSPFRTALGEDPLRYVPRYRILEDRGERPRLLLDDPAVSTEYVLIVEAAVDVDPIRAALERAGGRRPETSTANLVQVQLQDLTTYADYRAFKSLLVRDLGLTDVQSVEWEPGRVVLAVKCSWSAPQLLEALVRAAGPNDQVIPLGVDRDHLLLRFTRTSSTAPGDAPSASQND